VCRISSTISPNGAIVHIRLIVEDPLVVEDGQYFLGKVLLAIDVPHHIVWAGKRKKSSLRTPEFGLDRRYSVSGCPAARDFAQPQGGGLVGGGICFFCVCVSLFSWI